MFLGIQFKKFLRIFLLLIIPYLNLLTYTNTKAQQEVENQIYISNTENNFKDVYIIGPGDVLEIKFLNNDLEVSKFRILKDGNASIPFVGFINLNELTLNEATKLIKEELSKEIIYPEIQLKLIVERPIRISLIGEVKSPGVYNLNKEILNQTVVKSITKESIAGRDQIASPTIVDAIIASGGITKNANIRKVNIKRKLPKGIGGFKKTTIDLHKLILEGDLDQNLNLYDGDIIFIEKASNALSNDHRIFKTNLTKNKIDIFISGEIKTPGKIELDTNTKLIQAIYKAGGPINYRANRGRIDIIRSNNNGSISLKKYKLKLKDNIGDEYNPTLKDGDVVRVSTSNIANVSDALETFSKPISSFLNFYTLYSIIADD